MRHLCRINRQRMQDAQFNKRIFNYACWLLARRRYSVADFREKLRKKFPEMQEERKQVAELFLKRKYLDDGEYARLFVRDQLTRKPQGARLIKQKLSRKGIKDADIARIMEDENLDESSLALEAVKKKLKTLKASSGEKTSRLQLQQKLYRFLASRGFSPDITIKTLKALTGEELRENNETD